MKPQIPFRHSEQLMRALFVILCLAISCASASAKDLALSPLWSGAWVSAGAGHRCSVRIGPQMSALTGSVSPARTLDVLCGFGFTTVASTAPLPEHGGQIFLSTPNADFGTPSTGTTAWGTLTWFPVCDANGPALYAAVFRYAPSLTLGLAFRPASLDYATAAQLCGGAR